MKLPNRLLAAIPILAILAACGGSGAGGASTASGWDRVVDAAKKEGKVAVMGPQGTEAQAALTETFQKAHGIAVDFVGGSNRTLAPRVETERAAGQYLWDVRVGGAIVEGFGPLKALKPLEPELQPELKDPKLWRGGAMEFNDKDRTVLVMSPFHRGILFVNPNLAKPDEFKSYKDLLDPKWKGKIVLDDPRVTGAGQATMAFFYVHPDLGPDFIRSLAKQDPIILKDQRQELDFVAQGKAPILIGASDATAETLIHQGLPIAIVSARQLREGTDVSPANGQLALFDKAPHPNAAKVYVNWLLSKEGQTAFTKAQGYVSARLDVPHDHVQDWRVPSAGAIKTYDEQSINTIRAKVAPLLIELFGAAS